MAKLASLLTALMIFVSTPALAQDRTVLVELFTSQGCSSCPPADKFLHNLAKRDDVVALAFHVDYWDYIGWKDSFASPDFTARQRAYARAGNRRMVYTPQMVINGADHVVGNRPMDVTDLIKHHKARPGRVKLVAQRSGGRLTVQASAVAGSKGKATVQLFRFRPKSTVDIKRGENAGRTLSYANVVTEMTVLSEWNLSKPLALNVPLSGDLPAVVLVQQNGHGPVEAVVRVR